MLVSMEYRFQLGIGRGEFSLVSFTSDHSKAEWGQFKKNNTASLQLISSLIDTAASVSLKLSAEPVRLSKQEEQCLTLFASGMNYHAIAEGLNCNSLQV